MIYKVTQKDLDYISSEFKNAEISFMQNAYRVAQEKNEAINIPISMDDMNVIYDQIGNIVANAQDFYEGNGLEEISIYGEKKDAIVSHDGTLFLTISKEELAEITAELYDERLRALDALEDEFTNTALIIRPEYETVKENVKIVTLDGEVQEYEVYTQSPKMSYEKGTYALENKDNTLLKRSTSTTMLPLGTTFNIRHTIENKMRQHRPICDVTNILLLVTMIGGAMMWDWFSLFFFIWAIATYSIFEGFPLQGRKFLTNAVNSITGVVMQLAFGGAILYGLVAMGLGGIPVMVASMLWLLVRTWKQASVFKE